MTHRAIVLAWAAAAVALCGPALVEAKAPPDQILIVRYAGRRWGTAWGQRVIRIYISKIGSTSKKRLVVQNAGKPPKPTAAIVKVVKTLELGDVVRVTVGRHKGVTIVKKIELYKLKPGEDDPSGYIFVEAEEDVVRGKRVLLVTLKKLDKEITVQVATKKDAKGKEKTDPDLAKRIAKCKPDKVVDVELGGTKRAPVLVYIGKYLPPVEGIFTKLIDKSKDDPNKTAIKATVYGKTKTYFLQTTVLRGKIRVDAKLLFLAKKLKPGDLVEIKYRPYGKHQLAIRMVKLKKSKDDDI